MSSLQPTKHIRTLRLKQLGWCASVATSLLGLWGVAWVLWSVRNGFPRGPAGSIVAGLVAYASLALRLGGAFGLSALKPGGDASSAALVLGVMCTFCLGALAMPLDMSLMYKRIFGVALVAVSLGCDVFLLTQLRRIRQNVTTSQKD